MRGPTTNHARVQEEKRSTTTIEVSDSVLQALKEAEEARGNKLSDEAIEQMRKILDTTREMSTKSEADTNAKGENEKFQKDFESLSDLLKPKSVVPKEDIQVMKEKVFGPTSFWVTGTLPNPDLEGGVLFRGNLRDDKEVVFRTLNDKTKEVFGGKYELFMSEDFEAEDLDSKGTTRVRFLVVPAEAAQPPAITRWQVVVCVILAGLTVGSAFQLGIAANINRLPPDIVAYFLNPQNMDSSTMIPKLEELDVGPVLDGAFPIMGAVLACAGIHEAGHFFAAAMRGVKLSPPYFIPNGQIGTFGAITQFKSLVSNREDMFDVAIAGPLAGGSAAAALFVYGLICSMGGDASNPDLVSIPTALFNNSFLLGSLCRAVLGGQVFEAKDILIHPMLIAGWCALTTTALNCLPVGSLDGGRVVQSAWGRRGINISSLLTYAGLGFGIIGGSLSLSWGLFILICQRVPEKFVKDSVTGVDSKRSNLAWVMVILALLILFPFSFTLPQDQGIFI